MFTFLSKSSARKDPHSVSNCLHFRTENSLILGGLLRTEVSESSLSCNLISGIFPSIIHVCVVVCVFRGRWMRLLYMFLRLRKDWQFLMRKAKKMGMINSCVYLQGRETDKNWKMVTVPQFCDSWYPGMLVCEHSVMPCSRAKIQKR